MESDKVGDKGVKSDGIHVTLLGIQLTCQSETPLPGQIAVFRNNGLEKGTVFIFTLLLPASVARHIHLVLYWSLLFSIAGNSFIGEFCLSFKKKLYICKGSPWELCCLSFWQNVFHSASKGVQRWALRNAYLLWTHLWGCIACLSVEQPEQLGTCKIQLSKLIIECKRTY